MATRDEILQAFDELADRKAGLTVQELLPHCEACGHDEQIVASTVARLCAQGALRRDGFRGGENVYYRQQAPAVAPSIPAPQEAAIMKPKLTVPERILEALGRKSPLSVKQIAHAAGTGISTIYTTMSQLSRAKKVRPVPSAGRGYWELATPIGEASKPPAPAAKTAPALRALSNGHAVVGDVEKGIPLPPSIRYTELTTRLRELEVGDSFYTTVPHATFVKSAKRLGIHITRRKEREGFRIWRIKQEKP